MTTAIRVTEHCRLRYLQRVGIDAPHIQAVWKDTIPVEIEYRENSEAYLNEEFGVIFLIRDETIVTVLHAEYEAYVRADDQPENTHEHLFQPAS